MPTATTYLTIEEITYGDPVERDLLDDLLELDLVDYRRAGPTEVVRVAEHHCEDLRAMLRLATVLGVNPAGVATIMHMRRRQSALQRELRALRQEAAAYRALRGPR